MSEPEKKVVDKAANWSFLQRLQGTDTTPPPEMTPPSEIADKANPPAQKRFLNTPGRDFDNEALEGIFTHREEGDFSDGFDFKYDGNGKMIAAERDKDEVIAEQIAELNAGEFAQKHFDAKQEEYAKNPPPLTDDERKDLESPESLYEDRDL